MWEYSKEYLFFKGLKNAHASEDTEPPECWVTILLTQCVTHSCVSLELIQFAVSCCLLKLALQSKWLLVELLQALKKFCWLMFVLEELNIRIKHV